HDVDDTVNTARIARWLPEFRERAGLPDGVWRERWVELLGQSAELGADDDRAIVRDNRPHGYPTQSLLVCLADVSGDQVSDRDRIRVDSAVLTEPAHWHDPGLTRVKFP